MAKLKTGRHTSALKEARKAEKRSGWNLEVKNRISDLSRKFKAAAAKNEAGAKDMLKDLFSLYDKAAKKGVYHINKAARKKSQLTRLLSKKPEAKA